MKTNPRLLLTCIIVASSAAWAGDLDKKADKLDTDNDGKISRTEYNAEAERMFAKADANQDGALTPSEIEMAGKDTGPKNGSVHNDQKRDDMGRSQWLGKGNFQTCDTDGDGRISVKEGNAARDKHFTMLDADKDGSISMTELEAGHKMMKDKHD
ncbi:MAG: EF-hand domain-containing protein [Burkholderiales bacterium]|nr:EF-hand domain-containing protein [Opitutaceae bacterium]